MTSTEIIWIPGNPRFVEGALVAVGFMVGLYCPWGTITNSGKLPTAQSAPQYCASLGHPSELDTTGLIYMRARYYDPAIGRFISEDPARDGGNWFLYAGGNPIENADVTGRSAVSILANITGYSALLAGGVWIASAVLGIEVAPSVQAMAYAAGFADMAVFAGAKSAGLVAAAAAYEHPWSVATGMNIGIGFAVGTSVSGVAVAAAMHQIATAIIMDEWEL